VEVDELTERGVVAGPAPLDERALVVFVRHSPPHLSTPPTRCPPPRAHPLPATRVRTHDRRFCFTSPLKQSLPAASLNHA
jgi:hypothetical protein